MIFGGKKSEEIADLKNQVAKLEEQNKLLRASLEFYADANTWELGNKYVDADDATIFTDGTESAATADKGSKAAHTLKEIKSN